MRAGIAAGLHESGSGEPRKKANHIDAGKLLVEWTGASGNSSDQQRAISDRTTTWPELLDHRVLIGNREGD